MLIYNLRNLELEKYHADIKENENYIIVISIDEIDNLPMMFDINSSHINKSLFLSKSANFISYQETDFLNYIYFKLDNDTLVFENISFLLKKNFILFIHSDKDDSIGKELISNYIEDIKYINLPLDTISYYYYLILNKSFTNMFKAINDYESLLTVIENDILMDKKGLSYKDIVRNKKVSFTLKKNNRQLLYLGDQILLNDNNFIEDSAMKYFHNLDTKINILYQYSADVDDFSEHLMDVFDSHYAEKNNFTLNKLTIVTAVATPITVLTGLYGMNFVNMPELYNPYGYYTVLLIMAISTFSILMYFRHKKML